VIALQPSILGSYDEAMKQNAALMIAHDQLFKELPNRGRAIALIKIQAYANYELILWDDRFTSHERNRHTQSHPPAAG
jgi:hypothetical protein